MCPMFYLLKEDYNNIHNNHLAELSPQPGTAGTVLQSRGRKLPQAYLRGLVDNKGK